MSSYSNGFYYNRPQRGEGVNIEWEGGYISCLTKSSALEIKRELVRDYGHSKDAITIEKN